MDNIIDGKVNGAHCATTLLVSNRDGSKMLIFTHTLAHHPPPHSKHSVDGFCVE